MKLILLFTAMPIAALAVIAISLALLVGRAPPSEGEDEGPPQVFRDLAEAERAAGYSIPHARSLQTWRLTEIRVVPIHLGRRELRDAGYGILAGFERDDRFAPGLHNYVDLKYELSADRVVFVTVHAPIPERYPNATPPANMKFTTERLTLGRVEVTFDSIEHLGDSSTVFVSWQRDGVPFTTLAILTSPSRPRPNGVTREELQELIAAIR
jgi:hypothetical protein